MSGPQKYIYQCEACGVVFGPQSATDIVAAVRGQALRLAAKLCNEADKSMQGGDLADQILALIPSRPPVCAECDNLSDPPSKLCPGCQAYRDHQS